MDAHTPGRYGRLAALSTVLLAVMASCDALPLEPDGPDPGVQAAIIEVIDLTPQRADFPTPRPDTVRTSPKTPVTIPVLANDADTLYRTVSPPDSTVRSIRVATLVFPALVSFTQPGFGRVVAGPGGTLVYTPESSLFWGADRFTYTVVNEQGLAASTTVTVFVTPTWGIIPRRPPPDSTRGGD